MIKARDVSGHFQQMFQDEHIGILGKYIDRFLRRLEANFNNLAKLHILERGYQGRLTFRAQWDGEREVTLTPSDIELFKKLEMGEFDKDGKMIKEPHSVLAEWRIQVKIP